LLLYKYSHGAKLRRPSSPIDFVYPDGSVTSLVRTTLPNTATINVTRVPAETQALIDATPGLTITPL